MKRATQFCSFMLYFDTGCPKKVPFEINSKFDQNRAYTLCSMFFNNALCCYPNGNGAIRNLSLNTSTASIFLQFNYFRENIWVRIWVQFHFLYIFVGRVDRIYKTSHITMLSFYFFPLRPPKFWGRVEQIYQNGPRKYLSS